MQNDMRDRLMKKIAFKLYICNESDCADCEYRDIEYDKCKAMFLADSILEDGWIRPPCKVGDTLYEIVDMSHTACNSFVSDFPIMVEPYQIVYKNLMGDFSCIPFEKIGKTIFFTKEQAEQKLKEMRVENGNL